MEHESSNILDLKSNPKRLHKYIRQKQKVKHITIGPLKRPDRSITLTNEESAEALACLAFSLNQFSFTKIFKIYQIFLVESMM